MNYLYHRLPINMKGKILFPLNKLKLKYPSIYKLAIKKYHGRKLVQKIRIPTLNNCLWNDVIHLTAVHPKKLKDALTNAGATRWKEFSPNWLKINPYHLDPKLTTIYLYNDRPIETRYKFDNFTNFNPSKITQYNKIKQKTINHFKQAIKSNTKLFPYNFIPHILYQGPINIKKEEIIEV